MAKAVNWQSRNQHLNGKIPFRSKLSCGQLKTGFRGEQGIYPSYPLTAAWNANNLKAFLLLIVRIGAAFSCRWLFSVRGGFSLHRAYSISPGWNREGMAGRRQYTAFAPFDEVKQPPTIHPKAGQQNGTTCTAGSRKCFVRTRILLHRQRQGSSRSHSCSTDGPVFLLCGIGSRSSRGFSLWFLSPPFRLLKNSPYLSVHFESKMTPPFENKFAAVKKHLSYTSTFFEGLLHW